MKKIIKIILVIAIVISTVFVMGRYGWKLTGFKLCQNSIIYDVEVNENEVTIKGRDANFIPRGFVGYYYEIEAVKDAKKGDFIYFDPPYDSDTSIFNSYTEEGFGKNEQVRLARVFKELSDRGCYVMLSNNKTSLISELYKDYNIYVIEANRNINSNGKNGPIATRTIYIILYGIIALTPNKYWVHLSP